MFTPRYIVSAILIENIKKIAGLTVELNNKRFPKLVLAELERSARALSAFSSTSIEGNPLPLSEVKKILKQAPTRIRDTEKEILNYNKALQYLDKFSSGEGAELSVTFMEKIHGMVTEGLIAPHRHGTLRNEPVFVNDPVARKPVYLPPDHGDVPRLMEELIIFTRETRGVTDPLIVAGIFHKQFVIIHPFMDGNGRTARLATKVLLARMGLNTFNLFSFENYYNKDVSAYFKAVGLQGNYYELGQADFTPWLEYFTEGIIDELSRVKKELEKPGVSARILGLKPELDAVLKYLDKNGAVNDREYAKITKRAKATRTLDFKKLMELGYIVRMEKGKNTYYVRK